MNLLYFTIRSILYSGFDPGTADCYIAQNTAHKPTQAHILVTCKYVLYKIHLRVQTSKNFYGAALIFVDTYFKSNICIIFKFNNANNLLIEVP